MELQNVEYVNLVPFGKHIDMCNLVNVVTCNLYKNYVIYTKTN